MSWNKKLNENKIKKWEKGKKNIRDGDDEM